MTAVRVPHDDARNSEIQIIERLPAPQEKFGQSFQHSSDKFPFIPSRRDELG